MTPVPAIIDCHAHLGRWKKGVLRPELLSRLADEEGIAAFLVSSLAGLDCADGRPGGEPFLDQENANQEVLQQCAGDARLLPLAVCQVGKGTAPQIRELARADLIHGLKFHPYHADIPADDQRYDPFLEVAREHELCCVFHAAPGCSDPALIYTLARRFPSVPVVLYHINLTGDLQHGINTARQAKEAGDAILYLELSWVPARYLTEAVAAVGVERVLFGSDAPLDGPNHFEKYRDLLAAIRSLGQEAADLILFRNSKRLFHIP